MPNKPFDASCLDLARNATGPAVTKVQGFLERAGYLSSTSTTNTYAALRQRANLPSARPGTFDAATVAALVRFQRFHGLPITGRVDANTLDTMNQPRCGFPDLPKVARFTAQGDRWSKTNLTYRIDNFTSDLTQQEVRTALAEALALWSAVTPLSFSEVTTGGDIVVRFVTGDHGDGSSNAFDGTGNVLAHAFYPPPNGGDIAGDAHFDDDETWTVNVPATGTDLVTVAAHEFGHSLGLDHSMAAGALMRATYTGVHRFLSNDDIDGIQSIYGRRAVERGHVLHLSGVTNDGHLWHTLRAPDGPWTGFGDVEGQTGDRGAIADVDLQNAGLEVHLVAVTSNGRLWHTIRRADGSWFPFGDVEGQTGDRGLFRRVGLAAVVGELHVCGVTTDGHLWHTIRRANGSWFPFGDVEGQTGDRGTIADVDCAALGGAVHVCAVSADGHLWHTIRRADGSWSPFGDVEGQTGDRGNIKEVACAAIGAELHVCAVSDDGHLWHTIRRADGSWFPFGDVKGQAGDRGQFVRVSIGETGGELHVSGVTSDGRLWHTIRRADGSWFPFGDVEGQAGDRGSFLAVSVDGLLVP